MGRLYRELDEGLRAFIEAQQVFFTATAPSEDTGHINVSPKGLKSFQILSPTEVAYLDLVGSGVETIAHVRQNERLVLMFCAFEGPPKILRLWGKARVVEPEDEGFKALRRSFELDLPARSIIRMSLTRIGDSCGYGVPLFDYDGERDQISKWSDKKGPEGIEAYKSEKNARSIDGLPGLRSRCP